MKTITIKLTLAEAKSLSSVADNGWGTGDFADFLNKREVKACQSAMQKLTAAIYAKPSPNDGGLRSQEAGKL